MIVVKTKILLAFLTLAVGCGTFAGNPEDEDDDTKGDGVSEGFVYEEVSEPVIPPEQGQSPLPSDEGLNVFLVDAPIDGLESVFVTIEAFEVKKDQGPWVRLEAKGASGIDLLKLQGEVSRNLGSLKELEEGTYNELRLILSDTYPPYAKTTEGSLIGFKIASGESSGIKIKGGFSFDGSRKDLVLDFDLRQSIKKYGNSTNPKYRMTPVVKVMERDQLGQIEGEVSQDGVLCLFPVEHKISESDQCDGAAKSMKLKSGTFVMGYIQSGEYLAQFIDASGAFQTEAIKVEAGNTSELKKIQ